MGDLPAESRGGEHDKFEIRTRAGHVLEKSIPRLLQRVPPRTASIVHDASGYAWQDAAGDAASAGRLVVPAADVHLRGAPRVVAAKAWAGRRPGKLPQSPSSPSSSCPTCSKWASRTSNCCRSWTPVPRILGIPGDGIYRPPAGRPAGDFKAFVEACHRGGIGVLIDWVPGHFPKDAHGLAHFDGTALFEHQDPRSGSAPGLGDADLQLRPERGPQLPVQERALLAARVPYRRLRVDAVASIYTWITRASGQWIPNRYGGRENLEAVGFLQQLNTLTHDEAPGRSRRRRNRRRGRASAARLPGGPRVHLQVEHGLDARRAAVSSRDPVHRRWNHNELTFSMIYAYNETSSCRSRTTRWSTASARCWTSAGR